jgi:hypothetical protein
VPLFLDRPDHTTSLNWSFRPDLTTGQRAPNSVSWTVFVWVVPSASRSCNWYEPATSPLVCQLTTDWLDVESRRRAVLSALVRTLTPWALRTCNETIAPRLLT